MRNLFFLLVLSVILPQPCFGQRKKASNRKRVATSVEFVSKECGFKIRFPRNPIVEVNQLGATTIRDFKVVGSLSEWRVNCSDDKDSVEDENLKEKYSQSVKALLRVNRKLISQKDVHLKEKLGIEFIIEDLEAVTTTRAFLIQNRLYQIVFKQNKKAVDKSEIDFTPKDFFDSFSLWAEGSKK